MRDHPWMKEYVEKNGENIKKRTFPSPLLNTDKNEGKFTCDQEEPSY